MHESSSYAHLGMALLLAGAIAAPIFFFIVNSVPLTALALSSVLLGVVSLALAKSLPETPPQVARLLLETGLENLAGLIEELGVDAKAIYLPSSLAGGQPRGLIPLHADVRPEITRPLPRRMIVEFGPNPRDAGILVSTPGTAVIPLLGTPPGPTASELEAALVRVLVGALDLAGSVQVTLEPGIVIVDVKDLRFETDDLSIYRVIGTPIASIAAAIVAEGIGRPVKIRSEERTDRQLIAQLEVNL